MSEPVVEKAFNEAVLQKAREIARKVLGDKVDESEINAVAETMLYAYRFVLRKETLDAASGMVGLLLSSGPAIEVTALAGGIVAAVRDALLVLFRLNAETLRQQGFGEEKLRAQLEAIYNETMRLVCMSMRLLKEELVSGALVENPELNLPINVPKDKQTLWR